MTVSVLHGSAGPHAREFDRLLSFLAADFKPTIVHLTNSMLSGLAKPIKEKLGAAVVCSIQGEEHFVPALRAPYNQQATDLIRQNAQHIDRFIRPTAWGRNAVASMLGIPPDRLEVVPPAVEADRFIRQLPRGDGPLVIGCLSAIRPEKGLDLLIDALNHVAANLEASIDFRIAGQILDQSFWRSIKPKLSQLPENIRVDYVGPLEPAGKIQFLQQCDIAVIPSRMAEPRAVAAMEAMAAGCAVIGPRHGIFPELLSESAGLLFTPGDAQSLAAAIDLLIRDAQLRQRVAATAAQAAVVRFNPERLAARLHAIYASLETTPT